MAEESHPLDRPPSPPDASDPLIGTLVAGRYRIDALLGEGGMGQVYRALHVAIEKPVALKILRPEHSARGEIVSRFHQEAVSASRIKHPHVLDVFDFGQLDEGRFFLAMELLEGHDLADELVRDRVIEPRRAVCIALQIARALGAAHASDVVHRDLKPENVFLQRTADRESVKIVDFGIAQLRSGAVAESEAPQPVRRRLTRTGMIFGTPEYMSPEQALGVHADARSDIYSLGILLYEMLTGAVPFTGDTFMGVLTAHVTEPLPPLSRYHPGLEISPELNELVFGLVEKDPSRRPQSMTEVALELSATPEGAAVRSSLPHDELVVPLVPTERKAGVRQGAATLPRLAPPSAGDTSAQGGERPGSRRPAADRAAVTLALTTTSRGIAGAARAPSSHPVASIGAEPAAELRGRAGRPSARRRLWPAGAALLVCAMAAGTWMILRSRDPGALAPTSPAPGAPSATPKPAASVRVVSALAASLSPPPPSSSVQLSVRTAPAGALLFMNGAQVCDRTPCRVVARRDELVNLEARRGPASGKTRVLAQNDQEVEIPLTMAAASPKRLEERLCERYSEELGIKITVPCR